MGLLGLAVPWCWIRLSVNRTELLVGALTAGAHDRHGFASRIVCGEPKAFTGTTLRQVLDRSFDICGLISAHIHLALLTPRIEPHNQKTCLLWLLLLLIGPAILREDERTLKL